MDGDPLPTAEELEGWLLLSDALAQVKTVQGSDAYASLVGALASGHIRSASENYQLDREKPKGLGTIRQAVWQAIEQQGHLHAKPVWLTNNLEVSIFASYNRSNVHKFFTVRVDPAGIANMLPSAKPLPASGSASAPALPHAGGRPRKDYWDRLWAHIAAELYSGRLVPDKQAVLEKAMLDWATANGCALSEQSARSRARLVMAAIGKEGKN